MLARRQALDQVNFLHTTENIVTLWSPAFRLGKIPNAYSLIRVIVSTAIVATGIVAAEQYDASRLTLHDLASYGLRNSPTVAAASSDVITAQHRIGERRSFLWPQASIGVEYADVNDFNVIEDGEITGQRSRLRSDNVTIKQSIYDAVQISQWRKSQLEYEYALVQKQLAVEKLLSDIMELFVDFHLHRSSLDLLRNKREYLLRQRELLQLKNTTGSGSAVELLRLERSIGAVDIELHDAEFALANTKLDLSDAIGLADNTLDLQPLDDNINDLSMLLSSAAADNNASGEVINSLEIRELHFKLKLEEYDVRTAASSKWPNFYLEYQYDQTDVPGQEDERSISLNMDWSLFDGWASRYRKLGSLEGRRMAQEQYNEGLRRLERKFTRLQSKIDAGIKLHSINASILTDSANVIALTEMGTNYGSKNALDVLQAINDHFDAQQTQFKLFTEILRDLTELWQISANLTMAKLQQLSEILYGG